MCFYLQIKTTADLFLRLLSLHVRLAVDVSIPDRKCSIALPSIHLSLGDRVPAEIQLPVESPVGHI